MGLLAAGQALAAAVGGILADHLGASRGIALAALPAAAVGLSHLLAPGIRKMQVSRVRTMTLGTPACSASA